MGEDLRFVGLPGYVSRDSIQVWGGLCTGDDGETPCREQRGAKITGVQVVFDSIQAARGLYAQVTILIPLVLWDGLGSGAQKIEWDGVIKSSDAQTVFQGGDLYSQSYARVLAW